MAQTMWFHVNLFYFMDHSSQKVLFSLFSLHSLHQFLFFKFLQNGVYKNRPVFETDSSSMCSDIAEGRRLLCTNHLRWECSCKRSWWEIIVVSEILTELITLYWEVEFSHIFQFVWMGAHQLTTLIRDLDQG